MSAARSITFALMAGHVRTTAAIVAAAESLSFDGVWLGDQGFGYDPFVTVAAAASVTSTMRLGIGLTSPFTRLPIQIAHAVISLPDAADGRVARDGNIPHALRPLGIHGGRDIPRRPAGKRRGRHGDPLSALSRPPRRVMTH